MRHAEDVTKPKNALAPKCVLYQSPSEYNATATNIATGHEKEKTTKDQVLN